MTISEDHAWEVAKEMDREIERLKAALAEKEAELAAARDDIETLKRWIESMKGAE